VRFVSWKLGRPTLETLMALLESGDARPVVSQTHPLADAAAAVAHVLGHHARGKVVIRV
jgi:NADPH:quinone reductase-like Zn-dependent oxidoreductase